MQKTNSAKHSTLTADHALVGFDHVLDGDALRVLGVHHVDHLAQHVLELDRLLALRQDGSGACGGEEIRTRREKRDVSYMIVKNKQSLH